MTKKKAKAAVKLPAGGGERHAKTAVRPHLDPDGQQPIFSFRYTDRQYDGAWSWPHGEDAAELLEFICEMGRLTWNEIRAQQTGGKYARHRKHHEQPFDSVCLDAQKRLAELGLDETFEEFFRFRVDSEKRLWGLRVEGVFYVLWWDAQHMVKPSTKRHT